MTKEEIIQDRIISKMFKTGVNTIELISEAMEEYAQSQCSEKDARIKSLEEENERLRSFRAGVGTDTLTIKTE